METKYLLVFVLSCLYPFSVFCISDSSEEYRDERPFRSTYGIQIQWVDQRQVATTYKGFSEPAGYEHTKSGSTFLCRAYQGKTWIPGKLIGKTCYVVKDGAEHGFKEFQVPQIPAHKRAQWVSLNENVEERQLPRNVIVGGNHVDTTAYICRGYLGRILGTVVVVPGSYHPTENICYLGHNGAQVAWQGDTEVLVLNSKVNTANPSVPKINQAPEV